MKYDAAGRAVQTYDPLVHTCCENNHTYDMSYDGNGWKVKDVNVSTPPSGASYTETKHEIRSTVLGGETVGERKTFSSTGSVEARFITPVNGVRFGAKIESSAPEGIKTYGADGAELDTRGSDVGTENPYNSGDGGGNYPATGGDPTNYTRCAEGGVPMPCDPQSRISMNFDRIQDAINRDREKEREKDKTTPKPGPESAPVRESLHNSSSAKQTTSTGKPEPEPEKSGAVDPASVPDDGVSGRFFGPANGASFVTVRDEAPMVDASMSGGGGGGGVGVGRRGPKAVFNQKKFDKCLKDFFNAVLTSESLVEGLPGKGDDSIWHHVTIAGVGAALQTTVEKSSVTLGQELLSSGVGDGSPQAGATYNRTPLHNYIASEVYANAPPFPGGSIPFTDMGFRALKIHELGNALAGLRRQSAQGRNNPEYGIRDKLKDIGGYGPENKKAGIDDPDAGAALEICVFGGIVNLRTGRVGPGRGL
jgi:hypothetical protein